MTTTQSTKRQRYGGYGLTELRRMASEAKISGRSKMNGNELLAAMKQYWRDTRILAELAVIDAAKHGALLRHKSTGDIVRVSGDVQRSTLPAHDGALRFHAKYVEIGDRAGDLVGAWKGRGRDRARYLNDEQARRVENGSEADWFMLWQYEAI